MTAALFWRIGLAVVGKEIKIDLNEQAQDRCRFVIKQIAAAEGVTEDLKRRSQWEWVRVMNQCH